MQYLAVFLYITHTPTHPQTHTQPIVNGTNFLSAICVLYMCPHATVGVAILGHNQAALDMCCYVCVCILLCMRPKGLKGLKVLKGLAAALQQRWRVAALQQPLRRCNTPFATATALLQRCNSAATRL